MKSDFKLKEDIEPLEAGDVDLSPLIARRFKMKGAKRTHFGFIAQEVESTPFKNLVYENRGGYKSVAYQELIAILVYNIQQLTKRVELLEGRK